LCGAFSSLCVGGVCVGARISVGVLYLWVLLGFCHRQNSLTLLF
jgi:hypothetical protein